MRLFLPTPLPGRRPVDLGPSPDGAFRCRACHVLCEPNPEYMCDSCIKEYEPAEPAIPWWAFWRKP